MTGFLVTRPICTKSYMAGNMEKNCRCYLLTHVGSVPNNAPLASQVLSRSPLEYIYPWSHV